MEEAKDELMAMERVLLQTIKFDFNIEHAHKFIIQVHLVRRALPIFVMALRSYLGFSIVKIYVMNYWNHLTKKKLKKWYNRVGILQMIRIIQTFASNGNLKLLQFVWFI